MSINISDFNKENFICNSAQLLMNRCVFVKSDSLSYCIKLVDELVFYYDPPKRLLEHLLQLDNFQNIRCWYDVDIVYHVSTELFDKVRDEYIDLK